MFLPSRFRPMVVGALALGFVALVATPVLAAVPVAGATQLVSVNFAGTAGGDSSASDGQISADGRYVVFSSAADDLVLLDTNGLNYDVFRRDLVTGDTIMVSMSTLGFQGNAGSGGAQISADGRYVVFDSTSTNLDPLDTTTTTDVFIRDLVLFTTTLVSVNTAGTAGGDNDSYNPAISADGSIVTFTSMATDVAAGDVNGVNDVFYRTVSAVVPSTGLVSVSTALVAGDDDSGYAPASISADGRYVAFDSLATTFAPVVPGNYQLYWRDIIGGNTVLVSANTLGVGGSGSSFYPSMSADGDLVAFASGAADLVTGDLNGVDDIFVRAIGAATTTLASVPRASGGGTPNDSDRPALSADGTVIAWESDADNFVDLPVTGNHDVYARSLVTGTNQLLSINAAGTGGASDRSYGATLSADGTVAAFASRAVDLAPLAVSGLTDIFARGLTAAIVPPSPTLAATGSRDSTWVAVSAIGLVGLGAVLVITRRKRRVHAA
ncbi:MAG: hypothetical protein JWP19_2046 [Rhodoglobus sp.]|nr:hypothetical protein [Rhodoglobus sp.]